MTIDHDHQVDRSAIGTAALVATVISGVGLVAMIAGSLLGIRGFSDDATDNTALANTAWIAFSLGGLAALVTGTAAWLIGRRRGRPRDVHMGRVAVGYVVLSIVVSAIGAALQG